jgi:release factor glutamine methyltransferase
MKIGWALARNKQKIKKKGLDNPDLEAGLLLACALKKPREFLLAHPEYKLSPFQILKNEYLLKQRLCNIPLAYITGKREFFSLDFKVNKNVLIPRPETELIIEEALRINNKEKIASFVDIGTGSGCIIITLAKKIQEASFQGLDISSKALTVARANARQHKVLGKVKFLRSNLLSEIINKKILNAPIMVLANLPYLTPEQIALSPSIKKEPKIALIAGNDGLDYYRLLFKQIKIGSFPHPIYILCEIDESQVKNISSLINKELPEAKIEIKKDLGGFPRLVVISLLSAKENL